MPAALPSFPPSSRSSSLLDASSKVKTSENGVQCQSSAQQYPLRGCYAATHFQPSSAFSLAAHCFGHALLTPTTKHRQWQKTQICFYSWGALRALCSDRPRMYNNTAYYPELFVTLIGHLLGSGKRKRDAVLIGLLVATIHMQMGTPVLLTFSSCRRASLCPLNTPDSTPPRLSVA